jgi:hypothetical protein
MEEATELGNYLAIFFKTRSEQDYIAFLWDSFETNYSQKGNPGAVQVVLLINYSPDCLPLAENPNPVFSVY